MGFTRTVVGKRANFTPASGSDIKPQAIYGTNSLGDYVGIIRDATFKDLGDKKILTNNTVADTITYTGLGVEVTYTLVFKSLSAKPMKGEIWQVPAPGNLGMGSMLVVVDEVSVKLAEEEYRTLEVTATYHPGLMDGGGVVSAYYEGGSDAIIGTPFTPESVIPQPTVNTGLGVLGAP